MDVQITNRESSNWQDSVTVLTGKTEAYVSLDRKERLGARRINVTCQNSCHQVWRGPGRFFDTWKAAKAGYKSAAMKSAVECARVELSS